MKARPRAGRWRKKCNIGNVAGGVRADKLGSWSPSLPMMKKISLPAAAAQKKLHARIAAAQKQADAAKKEAKLAKLDFRNAKRLFKDARRAAKKLRKEVKTLKAELTALAAKKSPRKSAANPATPKPAAKRVRLIVAPKTTASPFEARAAPVEIPADPVAIPPPGPTA